VKLGFQIEGNIVIVDAGEGESVMEVAVRNNIPRVIGECGGEMSCATCHVYAGELPESMPPASADELDMLEVADDREDSSRLGCQIRLRGECDGMKVVVPPR
jgi:2Fe-2S ferredoxin